VKITMNIVPESYVNYFRVINKLHQRETKLEHSKFVIYFITFDGSYGLVKCPRIMKWVEK
jgi:hypothetical protein